MTKSRSQWIVLVVLALLGLALPVLAPGQPVHYAILALNGVLWTLGLNFFFGYCGQINFGVAGFAAVAGYGLALLAVKVKLPLGLSFLLAIVGTALVTYLASLVLLRLRELVLGLGTLAFSLMVYMTVRSGFIDLTGGEDGISLPKLVLFGSKMGDQFYYYVYLVAGALGLYVAYAVLHSRTGRAMRAIAEDEDAAIASGVDVRRYMRLALLLNGVYAGVAGAIYVQWNGWVSPEYFGLMANVLVLLALVVGGTGRPLGAVVGALLMFPLPQALIALEKYHYVIYGLILILMLRFAPHGLVGLVQPLAGRLSAARKQEARLPRGAA